MTVKLKPKSKPKSKPMSFQGWCERNGRLWTGTRSFEEFERNAKDYEAYLAKEAA